jgi:hypothetical protein
MTQEEYEAIPLVPCVSCGSPTKHRETTRYGNSEYAECQGCFNERSGMIKQFVIAESTDDDGRVA